MESLLPIIRLRLHHLRHAFPSDKLRPLRALCTGVRSRPLEVLHEYIGKLQNLLIQRCDLPDDLHARPRIDAQQVLAPPYRAPRTRLAHLELRAREVVERAHDALRVLAPCGASRRAFPCQPRFSSVSEVSVPRTCSRLLRISASAALSTASERLYSAVCSSLAVSRAKRARLSSSCAAAACAMAAFVASSSFRTRASWICGSTSSFGGTGGDTGGGSSAGSGSGTGTGTCIGAASANVAFVGELYAGRNSDSGRGRPLDPGALGTLASSAGAAPLCTRRWRQGRRRAVGKRGLRTL